MAALCKLLDQQEALTGEYFGKTRDNKLFSFCSNPRAISQRELQRWIQRQTERDMYVCNLMRYAGSRRILLLSGGFAHASVVVVVAMQLWERALTATRPTANATRHSLGGSRHRRMYKSD